LFVPKREPLSLEELVTEAPATNAATPPTAVSPSSPELDQEEEEFDNLYIRCPRSLVRKLRRRAFELSETRRKRVSQTELVIAALREFLVEK
jgi:hypothetical protein